MTRVRVDVTAEDIFAGARKDPCFCPIALALTRTFNASSVSVAASAVVVHCAAFCAVLGLPHEAWCFTVLFDSQKAVEPFSFYVDLPWL